MKFRGSAVQPVKDRLFWSGYIDLLHDRFVPTNRSGICDSFYEMMLAHPTYTGFCKTYINDYVVELYRDDVAKALEPKHVLSCMKTGMLCSVNYCTKTSAGNQRRLTITIVPADPDFNSGRCVITASSIDNEYNILMELEEQEEKLPSVETKMKAQDLMLQSLDNVFHSIAAINLRDHQYQEIISGEGIHPVIQDEEDPQRALQACIAVFVSDSDQSHMKDFFDLKTLAERIGNQKSISAEFLGTDENWVRASFFPVQKEEDGSLEDVLLVTQLVDDEKNAFMQYQTALKNALDDAVRLAETDGMTQLFNRRSGEKHINQSLLRKDHGMFCLFDVDDFKHFNDAYGHAVGDKVLQGVSACMKHTFRDGDILVRAGGDEFIIFAPGLLNPSTGERKLHEMAKRIEEMTFSEFSEKVTVSIGTVYSTDQSHFKDLFLEADDLMYENKVAKKKR